MRWKSKFGIFDFGPTTLSFGGSDTVKSLTIPGDVNGILAECDFSVPVWTNSVTATLSVERPDGTIIFTGTPRAKGATVLYFVEFPGNCIVSGEVVKVTLSGAPGGSGGNVIVRYFGK